jgi:ABC-type multidrug transport system ATPase subunit/ABC-type multidrug transport system permease subunit
MTSPEITPTLSMLPTQRTETGQPTKNGSLAVDGLIVDAPNGTRLLEGVGFVVPTGTMLAVAGPTGSGKTTLARALTGALPVAGGAVTVGGRDVTKLDASRRGIGYVPQEDALHSELSVRRTLDYAAALRMPDADSTERQSRIDAVLDGTRLSEQAGLTVGSLSVGQRKRVCIAIELLSLPSVLVLDEPTSSLDPGYEESTLTTLRGLADLGHAIVIVTHSQAAIASCDRVVLLTAGGRLGYFGSPSHMHERFGTTTAGELFCALDAAVLTVVPGHPSMARRAVADIDEAAEPAADRRVARRQLAILSRRYFELLFADRRRAWLFAVQGLLLGGLLLLFVAPAGLARPVGELSFGAPVSATGTAVLLVTCMTWLGMSNTVREIVKERHLLVREHRAGLSPAAYVGSKVAVLGPLLAAEAAVITVIAVARQHVPGSGAVLPSGMVELVIAMALAGISAVALGLFVSAVVRSNDKALAVLPMLVVVEFVLSGLTPSVSWMPGLAQLRDVSGTHWAVQAMQATVTGDSGAWWVAIAALLGFTAAALGGTVIAVRRSLRLPVAQPIREPFGHRVRLALGSFNPEMLRLSRLGAACLAAVAVIAIGVRVIAPIGSADTPAASAAAPAQQPVAATSITDELPGVLGDFWWMLRTGTQLGLDVSAAAYLASSSS